MQGIALGHARVSNAIDGPRPALNREVLHGLQSLLRTDPRTFVRQLFKLTGGEQTQGGYGEAIADEWVRRVPMELAAPFYEARVEEGAAMGERLASLDVPMLLAQHKGCLLFTEEGFDDAVAAFPDARGVPVRREAEHERRVRARAARVLRQPVRRAGLTRGRSLQSPAMAKTWQDVFITPNGDAPPRRPRPSDEPQRARLLPAPAREPLEVA